MSIYRKKKAMRILFVLVLLSYILWRRTTKSAKDTSRGEQNLKSRENVMKENFKKLLVVNDAPTNNSENDNTTCHLAVSKLGAVEVNMTLIPEESMRSRLSWVLQGGRFQPGDCVSKHKVAVLVPVRNRYEHLMLFLNHMHDFLSKQLLDYGIFVVEQAGNKLYNKGKSLNAGFMEAQKAREGGWTCFIFNDVDLLPIDARNLYTCSNRPRLMSVAIDKFNFKLAYKEIFGGVIAMTPEHYITANGFSNRYWGWGGEDDDLRKRAVIIDMVQEVGNNCRFLAQNVHVYRSRINIARYIMLKHNTREINPKRYMLLKKTQENYQGDGLSSVTYKLLQIELRPLYTYIKVDIDEELEG